MRRYAAFVILVAFLASACGTAASPTATSAPTPTATAAPTATPVPSDTRVPPTPTAAPSPTPTTAPSVTSTATPGLQTVQGDGYGLAYPSTWSVVDLSQNDWCKNPGLECLLGLAAPVKDGANLNLMRFAVKAGYTMDQLDQEMWSAMLAATPNVNLETRQTGAVANLPAVLRTYSMPTSTGGRASMLQVWVANGTLMYQFTLWAPTPESRAQNLADLMGILQSVQLAAPPTPPTATRKPAAKPTPTLAPTSQPALANTDSIAGRWAGTITGVSDPTFSTHLDLVIQPGCKAGGTCGTVAAPQLPCTGSLGLTAITGQTFVFVEQNMTGTSFCASGAVDTMRLQADGSLLWNYTFTDASGTKTTSAAVLKHP